MAAPVPSQVSGLMPNMTTGNPEVTALLEAYLETARKHPFGHIAIAMTGHPGIAAVDYGGEISLEESCREALGILTRKVEDSIASWTLPPRNEHLDASYVCYNVANGPLGFDFLVWLIDAEMTRVREGAPGPLVVAFFMGRDGEARVTRRDREAWVVNVFRPAVRMLGAVEDAAALHGRNKPVFVTRDIVAAARKGEAVPRFQASKEAMATAARFLDAGDRPPVTITLRESRHWPHRNSNLAAWTRFADGLIAAGETVIFVRDTARADEPLAGYRTCETASTDLEVRAALYQSARANLFVGNGPAALALFGGRPWLQFITVEPDGSSFAPNTATFWAKHAGVPAGGQYPWAAPDQRMVWAPDSYENISAAWRQLAL